MSFKNNDNNKPFDPDTERETTWHGRLNPITGKRPVTYTIGSRSDSPLFSSIDDLKREKRNRRVDPHRDSPIPDIFKTSSGETPTMDEVMPELKKRNEGWGEKREKPSKLLYETIDEIEIKKGGRNTKKTKIRKSRRTKKSRKTKKTRKSRKSKKIKKNRKARKTKKIRKRYGGQPQHHPEPDRRLVKKVLSIMSNKPRFGKDIEFDHDDRLFANEFGSVYIFPWNAQWGEYVQDENLMALIYPESLDKFNRILKVLGSEDGYTDSGSSGIESEGDY